MEHVLRISGADAIIFLSSCSPVQNSTQPGNEENPIKYPGN